MRILVTGGRDFHSHEQRMWLYAGLNLIHSMSAVTELIEGGAQGADMCAKNWALWRQACGDLVKLTTAPADWEKHGKSAGAIRNTEMARLRPDVVLACPGGRGTAHMVSVAQAHRLRVVYLTRMPVVGPRAAAVPAPPDASTSAG